MVDEHPAQPLRAFKRLPEALRWPFEAGWTALEIDEHKGCKWCLMRIFKPPFLIPFTGLHGKNNGASQRVTTTLQSNHI